MTKFIKSVEVKNGYNGHIKTVYLCQEVSSKQVWAAWSGGWYRFNQNFFTHLMKATK